MESNRRELRDRENNLKKRKEKGRKFVGEERGQQEHEESFPFDTLIITIILFNRFNLESMTTTSTPASTKHSNLSRSSNLVLIAAPTNNCLDESFDANG
jgi:hypothetical protein